MSNDILISPSLIASDLSVMGNTVSTFDPAQIDLLHMDVMDGHFVPNLTFGPGYVKDIQSRTPIPLDVHLMIEKPELSVESYLSLKPWAVTIHYEATRFPLRLCRLIRDAGCRAGLAINPATPVNNVFDLLPSLDLVLIMSIDPGFYGQPFMENALGRIRKIRDFQAKEDLRDLVIAVDGGVNARNIGPIVSAGATLIVAGSAAFSGGDVNQSVRELRKAACS